MTADRDAAPEPPGGSGGIARHPGGTGGRITRIWIAVVVAAWAAVALAWFFELWLFSWLWVAAWPVLGGLWVVAVVLSLVAGGRSIRRRSWSAAAAVLVVSVGAGVAIALTNWASAFAHGWFALHHDAFVETAVRADAGAFGPVADWPYYGVELPASLRAISVTGEVARVGGVGDRAVLLVPAYVGIPDGAAGFARIPPGRLEVVDGFGDPLTPLFPLGDDWWWVA